MRILFSSTRGAGHAQPLFPYAHALLRRGHDVRVAAPQSVGSVLQKEGLAHAQFDHPGDEVLGKVWARFRGLSSDEINAIATREIFAGLNARAALPKLQETILTWRPDLIVRESAEFAAAVAADEAGIRHVRVAVHNGRVEELFISMATESVDVLRRDSGLAPDHGAGLRGEPSFTSFPASLDGLTSGAGQRAPYRVSRPRDMTRATTTRPAWAPKNGRPFVYITFGTIAGTSDGPPTVYRAALDAVAGLPVTALLTTGPAVDAGALGAIPGNVTVEAWVPQGDVLPYATALVCHGGSGTVLGGLAAGVPMVVAPRFADQPQNARAIDELGAGIAVFDPDFSKLRSALQRVLSDPNMRAAAGRIAAEMAAMPSMDAAVDTLLAPIR